MGGDEQNRKQPGTDGIWGSLSKDGSWGSLSKDSGSAESILTSVLFARSMISLSGQVVSTSRISSASKTGARLVIYTLYT